jgi:hypothetical protein
MTYACPAWDTYLLKLQRMQNKVLRTFGNFPRCTPVRDLRTAFNLPYVEKISVHLSQGAWREDELIDGKPPVVK